MHEFEWNYNIRNQHDFDKVVASLNAEKAGENYIQLARLFCEGSCRTVMVELQVPTAEMKKDHNGMWLDCYEVESLNDYNAENEIDTTYGGEIRLFTFKNAEHLMLEYAKSLCEL